MAYFYSTVVFFIFLLSPLTGCVPYPVPSDTSTSTDISINQDLLLTLAPRDYLETFTEEITRRYKNIEVTDGFLFRNIAFPEGGWKLKQLLEPDNCARVKAELDIDYVVILGQEEHLQGEVKGIFIPFFGAGTQAKESRVSAAILDITSGNFECQINVEAEGHSSAIFFVIVGGGAEPLTVSSAIAGLAKETGLVIGKLTGFKNTRIAVIAAAAPLEKSKVPTN